MFLILMAMTAWSMHPTDTTMLAALTLAFFILLVSSPVPGDGTTKVRGNV